MSLGPSRKWKWNHLTQKYERRHKNNPLEKGEYQDLDPLDVESSLSPNLMQDIIDRFIPRPPKLLRNTKLGRLVQFLHNNRTMRSRGED